MKTHDGYTVDLDEPATCLGCTGEVAAGERVYVFVEVWDGVRYLHTYHEGCQWEPRVGAEASSQAVPA